MTKWFDNHTIIPNLFFHLDPKYYVKEETAIYMTHAIKFLALAMIGIFVPLYIFEETKTHLLFNSNEIINGFLWTILFYTIKSAVVVLIVITLAPLIFSKIKFQKSIIISSLAQIISIILLMAGANKPFVLMLSAIASALEVPFYWIPYHLLFMRKTNDTSGHFGQKTSYRFFLARITSGIAPLIGGLIISSFGFGALFTSAIVLLFFSGIPILTLVQEWKHHKHTIANVVDNYCLNPKYALLTTAFSGQALQSIILTVFWPVLLYFVLNNFAEIGLLNSISLLVTSVTLFVVGKWVDKGKARIVHGTGVAINALLNIVRAFIFTPLGLYAIDISDKLSSPMYGLPNMSLSYEKARRLGTSDFMIYRELVIHTFIAIFGGVLSILVLAVPNWRMLFLLAALGSVLAYAIDLDKN